MGVLELLSHTLIKVVGWLASFSPPASTELKLGVV